MGFLDRPDLNYESPFVQVLMAMYEDTGNQIAMQYAGSELANTMSSWTSNTLASQYGNTLSLLLLLLLSFSSSSLAPLGGGTGILLDPDSSFDEMQDE